MIPVVFTQHQRNFSLQQSETTAEKPHQSECRAMEPNGYIYKALLQLRLGEHSERGPERLEKKEEQGVCMRLCLLVTSEATSKVSTTWLPKHKLNKDHTNRHAKTGLFLFLHTFFFYLKYAFSCNIFWVHFPLPNSEVLLTSPLTWGLSLRNKLYIFNKRKKNFIKMR